MTGVRKPPQITREVRHLVRPGIEVVQAEACGLELSNHRVETTAQPLSYDYLIIALGADLAPEAIPGLSEASHTL